VQGNHDLPSIDTEEADAQYLKHLPFDWQASLNGKRIYLCHGIPIVNFIGFTADLLEKEKFQAIVRGLNVDILIAGHTHEIFCQKSQDTWIINPGSIYSKSSEGTSHSYAVLDLSASNFSAFDLLRPAREEPIFSCKLD
jgi:putative phosphoesterase